MGSFNHFDLVANELLRQMSEAVSKTAFDIQAKAALNAPVDTGFLKGALYTVTSKNSSYSECDRPTNKDSYLLPEVPAPDDDLTAYVAAGANYSVYVELGTTRAPAQPYLGPACDAAIGPFETAIAAINDKFPKY